MQQISRSKSPGIWWRQQEARYRVRQGLILARKGQYGLAIARLTTALRHHPQPSTVLTARGALHVQQGNWDTALDDLDQAIALDPRNPKAYGNRGLIRAQLGDHAGALADWETALVHRPDYAEAHFNRGLLLANQQDYPAALAEFDQALAANPNLAEAYFHRGNVRQELGDRPGAAKDWQLALLNDLSLDAAKRHLLQQRRTAHQERLTHALQTALDQHTPGLTLRLERQRTHLTLHLHRPQGTAIHYAQIATHLQHHLIEITPDIEEFRLVGRIGDSNLPDWNRLYRLYDNQPCPPSHWAIALLTTLLLFPPFGIIGLVYAAQVRPLYREGRYRAALGASNLVKWYFWLGLGVFGFVMLVILLYGVWLLVR